MSIEGISNYQHMTYEDFRPEWMKLERYDYCDQSTHPARHHYFGKLISFFKKRIEK